MCTNVAAQTIKTVDPDAERLQILEKSQPETHTESAQICC